MLFIEDMIIAIHRVDLSPHMHDRHTPQVSTGQAAL